MAKKAKKAYRRYFKKRRYGKRKRKLSILTIGGAVGGAMASFSGGDSIVTSATKLFNRQISPQDMGNTVVREIIGYDGYQKRWTIPSFTALLLGGAIASALVSKFGVNRALKDLPYVKL